MREGSNSTPTPQLNPLPFEFSEDHQIVRGVIYKFEPIFNEFADCAREPEPDAHDLLFIRRDRVKVVVELHLPYWSNEWA